MHRHSPIENLFNPRARSRGGATVEFALILLVLVPLLLGVGVIGVNLIRTLQTVQLARDAGHMYARGVDFSQPGNQGILFQLGQSVGLTTGSASNAVITLTSLTYVDKAACTTAGYVDGSGNPTSACANYTHWVFTQWMVIGDSTLRRTGFGTPLATGPTGVTINATTGQIAVSQYTSKAGALATFNSINPYSNVSGVVKGLPSGQFLYIAEAGVQGFSMAPFVTNPMTYSYGIF